MWKLLKISGHFLKALFWLAMLIAGCVIILLYILENGVPQSVVRRVSEKLSSKTVLVNIERITFTPGTGLHLHDVSMVPRQLAGESFGSIDDVVIGIDLFSLNNEEKLIRGVHLRGVDIPRHPRRIMRKLRDLHKEEKPDKPRREIPRMAPFKLTIEDACIVGLKTSRTTATVTLHEPVMDFSDITLAWQDSSPPMQVTGRVNVNLATEFLDGTAKGPAYPEHLTGLLYELGARTVIREMNRFTALKQPANADSRYQVNLDNGEYTVNVDLDIGQCAYRSVPLDFARVRIKAWETNGITRARLSDLATSDSTGKFEGDIYYDEETESVKVRGASTMDHNHVLTIIDILTHGELKPLKPAHPPVISAEGIVAVSTNSPVGHDLTGQVRFGEGVLFGLNVSKASAEFAVKDDHAYLKDAKATTPSGGQATGNAKFDIQAGADMPPAIQADIKLDKIDLTDLARVFSITNSRGGDCSGEIHLSGILGTNQLHTLNGTGNFKVSNSRIIRLKLFAGLTDYISRNIPGVSSVIDQSDCSLDFTIKDGVLSSNNFLIEGDVFSIQGKGTYDMAKDRLDFRVYTALFKQKTLAGQISRIVTFPFKKLLLEFKVSGSVDDPQWSYVNILEKITDQIPERSK